MITTVEALVSVTQTVMRMKQMDEPTKADIDFELYQVGRLIPSSVEESKKAQLELFRRYGLVIA